jgi:hypothetical protein
MDQETAIRKIEGLGSVITSQDTALLLQAIEEQRAALADQTSELDRLWDGPDRPAWQTTCGIETQIAKTDSEIKSLTAQLEPIEWQLLCLAEGSSRALVISKKIVAKKPFDSSRNNWPSSSLRTWLNGEFLASLPAHVRSRVLETPIDEAKDRVFLLSKEEAQIYFGSDSQRVAKYVDHAAWWWLRSRGDFKGGATAVDPDGRVVDLEYYYDATTAAGVRPALWLDLDG